MSTRKPSPPAPLRKPATLDHLRKKRTISRFVSFCTEDIPEPERPNLDATEQQRAAYEQAHAEWKAAVEDATVEFVVRSLSRRQYADLIESCPPTDEQIAEAKQKGEPRPDNNPDEFGPHLIAASIVEPEGITLEDAQTIWNEWPNGEVQSLANICLALNQTSRLEYYQGKSGGTRG